MKKLSNSPYDIEQIQWEYNDLCDRLMEDMWFNSTEDSGKQTCLQYADNNSDRFTDGAGSFRDTDKVENDYSILNPFYKNTIFETIINDFKGFRARFMLMRKHTTYSIHADKTPRLHLAIDTHDDALFLFPYLPKRMLVNPQVLHIPANGHIYEVDTTEEHTFVNAGPDRVHLVMVKND
ncbi:MAG: hypothetical protein VX478_02760 [Chloroflexota bacterium]|nr:hypothetical protein [Chloroflexota bacterium]